MTTTSSARTVPFATGLLAAAACWLALPVTAARAEACKPEMVAKILEPAKEGARTAEVTCDLTLKAGQIVTKQIALSGKRASDVTIDCGGGSIGGDPKSINYGGLAVVIRSRGKTVEEMTADRPEHIRIRNCKIDGAVHIRGLGENGEAALVRESSHKAGHTERAQAAAPTDIELSHVVIAGHGLLPLYIAPGVTKVTLTDSELTGKSNGPGVYLDAESAENTFTRNKIRVDTSGREQIAVDGSAKNRFTDNFFAELQDGGIFLYRNCGEGGTVRHQAPQGNVISGNKFYYRKYKGPKPAVLLGSRQGLRLYCGRDAGYGFGSSVDNGDHADANEVTGNRIVARDPRLMILNFGAGNRVDGNAEVAE